jgi:TPR repeat protein
LGRAEAIVFEGNRTFTAEQVNSALRQRLDFHLAAHPAAPLEPYLSTLRDLILTGYLRKGFPMVQVTVSNAAPSGQVHTRIFEGPRYKTGRVIFHGVRAIEDKTTQQRLLDALAGMPTPGSAGDSTNRADALWEKERYAPFDPRATTELQFRLLNELESMNYYHPRIKVSILTNAATTQADLVIDMVDEGIKGTLEEFAFHYPSTDKKNTDQELLDYLGLKPGMALSVALMDQLTNQLWSCGRFYHHDVALTLLAQSGKFKLDFRLEDMDEASPVTQPASTNEMALLRFSQWLNHLDQQPEDLVISGTLDWPEAGLVRTELVFSRSGVAFLAQKIPSNAPPSLAYAVVLSGKLVSSYSGSRRHKFVAPNSGSITAVLGLLPSAKHAPDRYSLQMGAGASTKAGARPVNLQVHFTPSAFLQAANDEDAAYSIQDGVLIAKFSKGEFAERSELKINVVTGRLIEVAVEEKRDGVSDVFRVRSEEGGFARIVSEIARSTTGFQDDYLASYPLSAWLGFMLTEVLESGVLESTLFTSKLSREQASATKEGARKLRVMADKLRIALGKESLAECFIPLERKLTELYPKSDDPEREEDPFLIPFASEAAQSELGTMFSFVGAWLVDKADLVWPRDTWPWTLTREAGFTLASKGIYTSGELQKLLVSDRVGPLGGVAAGALLARMNAPLSEKFVRRAIEQNSADGLQKDLAVLLAPESRAGKIAEAALLELGGIKDPQWADLASLFQPQSTDFLRATARLMGNSTNQSLAELLHPVVAQFWDPLLKTNLESALAKALVRVETPKTPQGAYERAQFILQSANKPEEIAEGLKLIRSAADQGYSKAQFALAYLYYSGEKGISPDYAEALKWFSRAAEQKVRHAACRVGDLYFEGKGVPQDRAVAMEWYRRDATNGCDRSQYRVGLCLAQQSTLDEALVWFRRSATNGFEKAQITLGDYLTDGFTVTPNYAEGYFWYRVAAKGGNRVAAVSARRISDKLTPAQIQAAEKGVIRLIKEQYRAVQQDS